MPEQFMNLRYHVAEATAGGDDESSGPVTSIRGVRKAGSRGSGNFGPANFGPTPFEGGFSSDEAAARSYLETIMQRDKRPVMRSLSSPASPEVVPDLKMVGVQDIPQTKTRLVRFEQTQSRIPIFGSLAVVELDRNRELVSVDAELAKVGSISPLANISAVDAVKAIATLAQVDAAQLQQVDAPELTYFFLNTPPGSWHLAYFVKNVPAAPRPVADETASPAWRGHGLGKSPRTLHPIMNYLVDAHSGDVIFYYPAAPTAGAGPGLVKLRGNDEDGVVQQFYGRQNGNGFELFDPFHSIQTYDLNRADIQGAVLPVTAVTSAVSDFQTTNTAAVAAHVYATAVNQFYKAVLSRDGIDDKGMTLVSVVNTTYAADEPPPEWHNAVWYDNRMWYGQASEGGRFRSYARFLDVIAHELTHGVTQYTCSLVYEGQSGALNESFSDIFGIFIKNWFDKKWDSPKDWSWEIGSGLGTNGLPLRDLSAPSRTGDPEHMNNFVQTRADSGGVHTNSNIHNKAAYNLITAKDTNGQYLFHPEELAILYYLCLSRLNSQANFSKVLNVLIDVANTFYAGDATERATNTGAIRTAYAAVGIQ